MNPLSWVHIDCQKCCKWLPWILQMLLSKVECISSITKLLKNIRHQSQICRMWECASSGAKMYYKRCCYWVWQHLIRIISSCCFQTEKKIIFAYEWNESLEEHGASPLSFTYFFKAAECLWHTPMRATHSRNLSPDTFMPFPTIAETSVAELG